MHGRTIDCARALTARDNLSLALDFADCAHFGDGIGGVGATCRGDKHKDGWKEGPTPADRPQDFEWRCGVHGALPK